ncbi:MULTISPECIES: ABC transporter ATP-binding protein [unclassified Roseofilum]|uniref:energy-coupling factor ABC transporter ATP-binding protein n=1 Tax=unclassified Roseofilum TaxID=2620099 RepID=UPI000E923C0C|nr:MULTISPECIES: ABC transporter ATP-binding protein [unclassified Roseofilum]MBP0008986.1 ABC transporter ATP-binding protein [Roseofilum sp. Belize Diploria]MBP0032982.1 ABC transporter ATP-binding protein [Roseofilum sp. Belize BBD 4]HBQ98960.1 cobalt ABC transporter ATP-binding protein [Cyanobacteria bacterium UBA11691]
MDNPNLLELRNVSYYYSGHSHGVFEQLSLKIQPHQRTVILGHNGSGKSTLFLLMTGLYPVDRGTIFWQGNPLDYQRQTLKQWRQNVGLAFQNPEHQLVAGTVAEDLSYGLCNLKLSKPEIRYRVEQAIADFHLTEIAHTPLHHLSLGQKRRVALAGVMVLQPKLLLLDEPTAYLDPQQLQTLLQELHKIEQKGTTIAIATHNLDFAYQWADCFIILNQGKLILEGEAETVFSQQKLLSEMGLGVPTLWEAWHSLPPSFCPQVQQIPRTLEDWKTSFNSDIKSE